MFKKLFIVDLIMFVVAVAVGIKFIVFPASAVAFFVAGIFITDAVWGFVMNRRFSVVRTEPSAEETEE